MKVARIENNVAVEVVEIPDGFTIEQSIHPNLSPLYSEVPDNVTPNSKVNSKGVWTIFTPEVIVPIEAYPTVSRIQFKLLFTSDERVAIKAATNTDPKVEDWWEIATDTSLPEIDLNLRSTQEGLNYLVSVNLLTEDRKAQILKGELV